MRNVYGFMKDGRGQNEILYDIKQSFLSSNSEELAAAVPDRACRGSIS